MASARGVPFWICQVVIDIDVHQEIGPIRLILDGCSDVLYGSGVDGGYITPHDMPPPPPCHQLEVDEVLTVEAEILDGKVLRLTV